MDKAVVHVDDLEKMQYRNVLCLFYVQIIGRFNCQYIYDKRKLLTSEMKLQMKISKEIKKVSVELFAKALPERKVVDMALYDWNGDGKKDFTEDFIEYNIYKRSMENRNNGRKPCSNPSFKGFLTIFLVCCVIACFNELVAAIIFGIYLFFTVMS